MLSQWIGGTGDWNTAANWLGGAVPGSSDDVTIPAGANVTISTDPSGKMPANITVGSITTAAGSTLTVAPKASLNEHGGTVNGTFNLAGTIGGPAGVSLTFAGTTVVTGMTTGGVFVNTGNMTINGGGFDRSLLTNNGAVTVSGGIILGGGGTGLGTFTNSAGATFTITDDSGFAPTTYPLNNSGTFINEGTFTKSGGTGTSEFPQNESTLNVQGEFENIGGTVNIDSGNFTIQATVALDGGQLNVATGSTLTITGSFNDTLAGTLTGSGGGTIALADGNFLPQAPGEVAADATLNFPKGLVQVGGADFTGSGTNTLTNTGYLNYVGSTAHGSIVMINQGTVTNSGSADLPMYNFINDTTGILDLQTDAGLTNAGGNGLTNKGVIRKSAGTGTSVLTTAFFNDGGSLDIESGSLAFRETNFGYIAGPIHIATGSALDFETSNGVYVQGTLSSTGGGTVTMSSGWFDGPNANFGENASATGARACCQNAVRRRCA